MFRMWAKIWKDNHLLRDLTVSNGREDMTRTQKIFAGIEQVCHEFDLSVPIWLPANISAFKKHDKVRFSQDNFIDEIEFDYLELHVIEEDSW